MKIRIGLLLLMVGAQLTAFAQTFLGVEREWQILYTDEAAVCSYAHTGLMTYGDNMDANVELVNEHLVLSSKTSITNEGCPSWFGIPVQDENGNCTLMHELGGLAMGPHAGGMMDHNYIYLTAYSDVPNAKIRVYLGSTDPGNSFPLSSTWQTGTNTMILAEFTLSTTVATYEFNLNVDPANLYTWNSWTGNAKVNLIGYDLQSPSATYYIEATKAYKGMRIWTDPVGPGTPSNHNNDCGISLGVFATQEDDIMVQTEPGGYLHIDQAFATDKAVVTDMFGRTEEFTGNDFHTQLRGMLVLTCVSGNRVKKAKVVLN